MRTGRGTINMNTGFNLVGTWATYAANIGTTEKAARDSSKPSAATVSARGKVTDAAEGIKVGEIVQKQP